MGLFSAIGNLFGARKVKKASRQAAGAEIAGLNLGIGGLNTQLSDAAGRVGSAAEGLEASVQGYLGHRDAGLDATGAIRGLLGLDGAEAQAAALANLKASPQFAALFGAGEEAILQNASATGGLRGGNTQRSLADFGADTFARIIQQQLDRLTGVADRGLAAEGGMLNARQGVAGLQTNFNAQSLQNAALRAELEAGKGSSKAGGILGAAKGSLQKYGAVGDLANMAVGAFPGLGGAKIGSTTLGALI